MSVPNLDCMNDDDLRAFAMKCGATRCRRAVAVEMFPDKPRNYTVFAQAVSNYAWNAVAARSCRLKGDIQGATMYEDICERCYQDIPETERW